LRTCCSDTDPCVRSRFDSTASKSCSLESQTGLCPACLSFRTCENSTDVPGAGSSISSTGLSLAKPSPVQPAGGASQSTFGPSNVASSANAVLDMSWVRTSSETRLSEPPGSFTLTVTTLPFASYPQPTWVPRIEDCVGGSWLPTPTETANYDAPSMRKQWPAHRRLERWTGGLTTPRHIEFLMAWPLGWSDSAPLAMESFQSWKERHGTYCDPWLTVSKEREQRGWEQELFDFAMGQGSQE
jgi:hypothetical protein